MAHLKKFSLAQKLQKLRDDTPKILMPLLFASGDDDCLFYSTEKVTNFSNKFMKQMNDLTYTMKQMEIAYLAANQVGMDYRVFTMQKQINNFKQNLIGNQNLESLLCINPYVESISETTNQDWEINACFPFIRCKIERYDRIKINFIDQNDEYQLEFEGLNARIVQQAIDSLNGYQIIDPRIHLGQWEINPKWKNVLHKTELTIDTYRNEIQKLVQSNPECFQKRNVNELNTNLKENDEEFSFESIMMRRLEKYIKREMLEPATINTKDELYEQLKKSS